MKGFDLYWGDFHKHLSDIDRCDEIINYAKYNLDVYCVLCYPFRWESIRGARIETVRQRPEFLEWWERLRRGAREHNDEGEFVTFLGYEWHGNRTRYGDHNVIYHDEDNPLDDAWELETLFQHLRETEAFAIPHHTAYTKGRRGKDWDIHDPCLSPVMEIYSTHGSSEGVDTPVKMLQNRSMGPRTSGGTFRDALARGIEIGCIASNDSSGLPGSWPLGVAGFWARDLTRDGIWEAVRQRRTVASTGDRIRLWFEIDGSPMGSTISADGPIKASVDVACPLPLDRVELVSDGRVIRSYCHRDRWVQRQSGEFNILTEFGWGPASHYGYRDVEQAWDGLIEVRGGELSSVHPRFSGLGQRFALEDDVCRFHLTTSRDGEPGYRQGLVLGIDGDSDSRIHIQVDEHEFTLRLGECLGNAHLFPFLGESIRRVETTFGLTESDIENPDIYYHNSRKVRVHPAYHVEACRAKVSFGDILRKAGRSYYYVRVQQCDGQTAWSSPIWVDFR